MGQDGLARTFEGLGWKNEGPNRTLAISLGSNKHASHSGWVEPALFGPFFYWWGCDELESQVQKEEMADTTDN